MKKTLIALSVASFAASSAYAQLDLDDPTSVSNSVYASEIDVSGTGVEVTPVSDVITDLGFSITEADNRFVKWSFTNGGNFVTTPTLQFLDSGGAPLAPQPNITLASTGADNEFVLFEISTADPTPIALDSRVRLRFAPADLIGLAGTTDVSYELFESGANGGTGLLSSGGPKVYSSFDNALEVGTTGTTGGAANTPVEMPKLIEVADDSLNFEGGGNNLITALGSLFVAETADTPTPALVSGAPATIGDILASHTVEIDGDFSAADGVFIVLDSGGSTCEGTAPLVTAVLNSDMNQAVFSPPVIEVGDLSVDGVETAATVCLEVTGTDVISEASYSGTYMPVANTGFVAMDVPFTLGSLGNTGTTITLNLTLTPRTQGGSYANFFRITNPTNTEGRVFIRLINDLGESSATIDMIDVYGDTNTVPAQGSSRQFDINDVYAAVQTADPTFMIPADGPLRKLRTVITGEFGSMDVQTYTVSTDATTFSTF